MSCKYPNAEHRGYCESITCIYQSEGWLDCLNDEDALDIIRNHYLSCKKLHGYEIGHVFDVTTWPNGQGTELLSISRHWVVCKSIFTEHENFFDIHPLDAEDGFMSNNEWDDLYS